MKKIITNAMIAAVALSGAVGLHADDSRFVKRTVLEEFSTEQCPNCPSGVYNLNTAISYLSREQKEKVFVVTHHSGYMTDWLTTTFDRQIATLYNDRGQMYAPAFMSDRVNRHKSMKYGYPTPVFGNLGAGAIKDQILESLENEALVSVELKATYDPDQRKLDVTVYGEAAEEFEKPGKRITVYLVEDDIKARNQYGGGSNFRHGHVGRLTNDVWGVAPVWNGNEYEYKCTFDIDPGYVYDNLEVVAFIHTYFPMNLYTDSEIHNANGMSSEDFAIGTGVSAAEIAMPQITAEGGRFICSDSEAATEVFTVAGARVRNENLPSGMYVVSIISGGQRFTSKQIMP